MEVMKKMKKMEKAPEISAQNSIYVSPPCMFCDFGALCGLNGISNGIGG